MEQVQDIVIRKVQEYLQERLADILTFTEIGEINEEIEIKILTAFWERGTPSSSIK